MLDRFANFEFLYLLFILPILTLIFILRIYFRQKALKKWGNIEIINSLMPEISHRRPVFKFILFLIIIALIITALARPQSGSKLKEVKTEGVEIIIALDVSKSMLARDISPSRLESAKLAIAKMIDKLENDKIGLIIFAGDAYTQVPITTDYSAVKMLLKTVSTANIPVAGTAIGKAIELATKSFSPDNEKNKVLVIITDGENHEDDPMESAKKAKEKNIFIHTIGFGNPDGVPIPESEAGNDFKRNEKNEVIVSKLDETLLQQIAATTGGIYARATNSNVGLNSLYDAINNMEKETFETKIYSDYADIFHYFVFLALFFALFDIFVLERKNRLFKNINLFK